MWWLTAFIRTRKHKSPTTAFRCATFAQLTGSLPPPARSAGSVAGVQGRPRTSSAPSTRAADPVQWGARRQGRRVERTRAPRGPAPTPAPAPQAVAPAQPIIVINTGTPLSAQDAAVIAAQNGLPSEPAPTPVGQEVRAPVTESRGS